MIYQESSQIEKDLINRRKLSQGVNIKFLPWKPDGINNTYGNPNMSNNKN
jgi:hypothetical protein